MPTLWNRLGRARPLSSPSSYEDDDAWRAKRLELEAVATKIPNGSHVFIGSTIATAYRTLEALTAPTTPLLDINIIQFLPGGGLPHLDQHTRRFRTTTFFAYGQAGEKVRQGIADYTPISSARFRRLMLERRIPIDVALVKVAPPDSAGRCSLGTGVDFSVDAVDAAEVVIAEVSPQMPRTAGQSMIDAGAIDWWTPNDDPLPLPGELFPETFESLRPEVVEAIAEKVLFEIPDGATLKFDLSPMAEAITPYLAARQDLGLYTELLTEDLVKLIRSGVITNARKNRDTGQSVVTHAHGGPELLSFVHENEAVQFRSSFELNRIDHVAQQDGLVSIVGGLKVDLSGQVAIDSVGSRYYAGVGSVDDSVRGAGYAKGGKPIVALPARSLRGNSNIVFALPEGTGVVITRLDVHYVVTEFGTAFLFGKTIRERCLALIDIAHPEFRDSLLESAKNSYYIHAQQPGDSFRSTYPREWECVHDTRQGKKVLVRPIKALDEDHLRDFFHKLSDQSVYMRYFTRMRSLPQKVLKRFADINYAKDMALVVLHPPETARHEIVAIGQWILDADDNIPEIAFQVRDDWQGEGLGKFLFLRLVKMAAACGWGVLKADVLVDNVAMNRVFESAGIPFRKTSDFGIYTYCFDLADVDPGSLPGC